MVINGGPKLANIDLDRVSHGYGDRQDDIKSRLEALQGIWAMIVDAGEDSLRWRDVIGGRRKRDQDDDDIERLSRSTRRTTRSQGGGRGDAAGGKSTQLRQQQQSQKAPPAKGARKRTGGLNEPALTETAVDQHNRKRRKGFFSQLPAKIMQWKKKLFQH